MHHIHILLLIRLLRNKTGCVCRNVILSQTKVPHMQLSIKDSGPINIRPVSYTIFCEIRLKLDYLNIIILYPPGYKKTNSFICFLFFYPFQTPESIYLFSSYPYTPRKASSNVFPFFSSSSKAIILSLPYCSTSPFTIS